MPHHGPGGKAGGGRSEILKDRSPTREEEFRRLDHNLAQVDLSDRCSGSWRKWEKPEGEKGPDQIARYPPRGLTRENEAVREEEGNGTRWLTREERRELPLAKKRRRVAQKRQGRICAVSQTLPTSGRGGTRRGIRYCRVGQGQT